MFFKILIKTIVDFTPMILLVLSFMAGIIVFVAVATTGSTTQKVTRPLQHRLTWDLTRDTRFINLD